MTPHATDRMRDKEELHTGMHELDEPSDGSDGPPAAGSKRRSHPLLPRTSQPARQTPRTAVLERTPSADSRNAFAPGGPVSSSHNGPLPGSTVSRNLRKAQHSCSSSMSCVRSAKTPASAANRRAYPSSRDR